jgi:CcmD family protein
VAWKSWLRPIVFALVVMAGAGGSSIAAAGQQQAPPKPAQDEFLPIDQLPPGEQLPAARFLIIAYAVAWVVVAAYLYSIWQRLGQVEREIADVSRRIGQSTGGGRPRGDAGGRG